MIGFVVGGVGLCSGRALYGPSRRPANYLVCNVLSGISLKMLGPSTLCVEGESPYKDKGTRSASLDELPTGALSPKPCEDETRRAEELQRERRLACLERAMRALSENELNLIIRYYQSRRHSVNVCHRREIAEQLGISSGALRVQAHRIVGAVTSGTATH